MQSNCNPSAIQFQSNCKESNFNPTLIQLQCNIAIQMQSNCKQLQSNFNPTSIQLQCNVAILLQFHCNSLANLFDIQSRVQGVWNIREIESTRPALPYDYTCRRYILHLNKKYLSDVQISHTCIQNRLLFTLK